MLSYCQWCSHLQSHFLQFPICIESANWTAGAAVFDSDIYFRMLVIYF
jgi:hypothetical protein